MRTPEHKYKYILNRRMDGILDTSSFLCENRVALETRLDTSPLRLLISMAEYTILFVEFSQKSGSKYVMMVDYLVLLQSVCKTSKISV